MTRKLPQLTRRTLDDIEREAEAPPSEGPGAYPVPTPPEAGPEPSEGGEDVRRVKARALVDRFMAWSAIGGAVPLPLVDLASIAVLQVQLVRRLAELYERPFSAEAVRSTLLAAAAAAFSSGGGSLAATLLARATPLGLLMNMWVSSGLAVVTTLAIGRAYILHFESGGTALDLDPATLAGHYRRALAERRAAGAKA